MKQVASFSKVEEAEMLRAFLEGAGIAASVRDGHTVTADWALSNAIGGVKVDVADEDVERALPLVREFTTLPQPEAKPRSKSTRTVSRYAKIATVLFILILIFIATTIGFRGDVPAPMLVISAAGIAAGIAAFLALYDL